MPRVLFLTLCLLVLLTSTGLSAERPDLLDTSPWTLITPSPAAAEQSPVIRDSAHGTIQTIIIHTATDPYYRIQLSHDLGTALPEGTIVRLHFWGRSPTVNPVRVVIEQAQDPYRGVLAERIPLTADWREYSYTASIPSSDLGSLALRFQVGEQAGTVQIGGTTVENLGLDPEFVKAQAALRPEAIRARIQRYRMADLTVVVHDAHGRPLRNTTVSIQQTRHAFLFGCNIFGLKPDDASPNQKAYQDHFAALFNYATLPFYWGSFEHTQGQPDYPRLDAMAQWCVAHSITPKGHPLLWHQVVPEWVPHDPDAVIPLLHARVTDLVTHYRGRIGYWDVVNEANSPDPKTGEGAWIARDGAASVVGTALGWARTAGQGAPETFLYNDFDTSEKNLALLTQLRKNGTLPDAIGIQSHMHSGVWSLADVWRRCEAFARFGKPIHFTETTVVSGPAPGPIHYDAPNGDWHTTPAGEAAQADYVAQFYTLLFSHPAVRAITWWDLSDRDAWLGAPAGLLRKDMSPKPAYDRLMTLIHQTWWTSATVKPNAKGRFIVHAFYGDYRITVTDSHGHKTTRQVSMPEASGPHTFVVTLP
jgi:endo-1,4-beta-xylanase